ncbi:MAG TPA: hypothetical protein VKJ65_00985 [Phycisphaerae bacterium]|nr:hypothetical protein [Phycisphaerae bacterium]
MDEKTRSDILNERIWEVGREGHENAQRKRMAALTLEQKIHWLEDAQKLTLHLQKSRLQSESTCGKMKGP